MKNCDITIIGKYRSGKPKYWCAVHFCEVEKISHEIPVKCIQHNKSQINESEKFYLDPELWGGGIGLWGSLDAVYNTSKWTEDEKGIHLHARMEASGEKEIDDTFKEVYIKSPEKNLFDEANYIRLDMEIATAYTASIVFGYGNKLEFLSCSQCNRPHIDSGLYAVMPHIKHMCTYCGKEFIGIEKAISNPVERIRHIFKNSVGGQSIELVDRKLEIDQHDFPGGMEIWGSNPAIIWTAKRSEEAGIHVHVYKDRRSKERVYDETYGNVRIDGILINEIQVRYLMVQKSLMHLNKKIISLKCPICGLDHFDVRDNAVIPHQEHICENCNEGFTTKRKCVSNPLINVLAELQLNFQSLQK